VKKDSRKSSVLPISCYPNHVLLSSGFLMTEIKHGTKDLLL